MQCETDRLGGVSVLLWRMWEKEVNFHPQNDIICHNIHNLQQICHSHIPLHLSAVEHLCGRLADFFGKNTCVTRARMPLHHPLLTCCDSISLSAKPQSN